MKRILSAFLFISLFYILICAPQAEAACAVAAGTTTVGGTAGTSFNILKMNTMSPANFKYPKSYTNTTRMVSTNNYMLPESAVIPNPYGYTNVNIYAIAPVYHMRSGAVYIDGKRNRKNRIKNRHETQYYEYYEY